MRVPTRSVVVLLFATAAITAIAWPASAAGTNLVTDGGFEKRNEDFGPVIDAVSVKPI